MNDNTKNYLGWALIVGVLVLAFAAFSASVAFSRASEPATYRSFAVSGQGRAIGVPDVAQFSFSVITEGGKDIAKLQTDNTAKINKAIAFVKQSGVADKDIKTESYQLNPRYQNVVCNPGPYAVAVNCPPAEIVGYTIQQTVVVKARDFSKLGNLVSGVVTAGANSVSQLNFIVDDPTALENQARTEAIAKAKEKAKAIAKAGGFSLGRLLTINENGVLPMYKERLTMAVQDMAYGMGGAAPVPAPAIEPGSQEINITINLEYEIN
jgi:uncharacterized protein YggE